MKAYAEVNLTKGDEDFHVPLVRFIIEQLNLIGVPKNGRRYFTEAMKTSFLWQLTSTSLYKTLQKLFILPSIDHLRKLSVGNDVKSSTVDTDYIKTRSVNMTPLEKKVILIIDEVYTAQRVEYRNGAFVGLTENGLPATTVLTFRFQSIAGKYKDVVCLITVNKLDTALLRSWFDKVLNALNDIFFIVAVCTNNYVCNRYVTL